MNKSVTVGMPNCKKILKLDGLNVVLKPCEPLYEYHLRKHLHTSTFPDLEKGNVGHHLSYYNIDISATKNHRLLAKFPNNLIVFISADFPTQ